ncbi:Averantin hydroxylase [Lasiodiplodia theobromae]|uniref:Averantin hydroxylase n=1 Tax=Lasiodiplodia theobromae TaxID=45133 RepID=A0A5N5D7K0_9PEZI|nr:Averantin hydroxylase [Lasiodiplodia theobromae]
MGIYRLVFSPIRNFPGPRLGALSSFYRVYVALRSNIRLFTEVQKLHEQYGDYVRVGPREISILNPSAIPLLYGPKTKCRRGPWYDHIRGSEEDKHVLNIRDPALHSQRRRVLDRGLSSKALADYESRVQSTVDDFVKALDERVGTPIDMTSWVNFFSFDAMGRIAYNVDFGMLKRGEGTVKMEGRSTSLKVLHDAMKVFGIIGAVPWLFRMISQTGGGGEIKTFFEWCNSAMEMKQRTFNPTHDTPTDIASHILAAQTDATKHPQTPLALKNTSSLLILAGSDTAASAMTNALFYLFRDPVRLRKLRAQLDTLPDTSPRSLASVRYLDCVLNETLRLKPPACEGLTRETPVGGITVPPPPSTTTSASGGGNTSGGDKSSAGGGTPVFIPANTIVAVPTWALHRDTRFWGADAADFRPERFEDMGDLLADTAPFIPFTRGACTCPGKALAYVEMRAVVAVVVGRFDVVEVVGGEEGMRAFDEGCVDSFTLTNRPLWVVLRRRER